MSIIYIIIYIIIYLHHYLHGNLQQNLIFSMIFTIIYIIIYLHHYLHQILQQNLNVKFTWFFTLIFYCNSCCLFTSIYTSKFTYNPKLINRKNGCVMDCNQILVDKCQCWFLFYEPFENSNCIVRGTSTRQVLTEFPSLTLIIFWTKNMSLNY